MSLIYMDCTIALMISRGTTQEEVDALCKTGLVRKIEEVPYLVIKTK